VGNRLIGVGVWERRRMPQGLKSKSVDYEREKERRWEAQGSSMKKEEKKKGKINEGDVKWGWVRTGSQNKEEKKKGKINEGDVE
jgi:hypothetical protein